MTRIRKLIFTTFLLTGALMTGACVSVLNEDSAQTRIPFVLQPDGRVTIAVQINDQGPFTFALDTAASISAVSRRVAREMNLPPFPGKKVRVYGAISTGEFERVLLQEITYGSINSLRKDAVVLPGTSRSLRGLDGILGLDVLRQFAVGFAVREKMVLLYARDSVQSESYQSWAAVPLTERPIGDTGAFVYSIGLTIRRHRIPAILDLGAEINVVNSAAARRLGLRLDRRENGKFAGALDSAPILANLTIANVGTRNIVWTDEHFSVVDLPVFEPFGLSDVPAAIVGANLLTQRDFIIDFARPRLLIRKSQDEFKPAE